jgi:hypothetical protein
MTMKLTRCLILIAALLALAGCQSAPGADGRYATPGRGGWDNHRGGWHPDWDSL